MLDLKAMADGMGSPSGSFGLGSVRREDRESITLNRDRAGDQLYLRISMQMLPWSEI